MINVSANSFFNAQSSKLFTQDIAAQAQSFHQKIEGYTPTPLISLPVLAKSLGLKNILAKDESHRFGLNAFKVLGGSYALGQLLAEKLNMSLSDIDLKTVASKFDSPMVFTTATAGNHGTGVAWAAREMGQKAVVYMPKGAAQTSVERIRGLGAECIVTDVNYDDTVRLANQTAQENNWELVQDTAWDGYEQIPTWISQGYMTMAAEALTQLDGIKPTHLLLQAGVGAMAGGVLGYYADALGADNITSVIVEPENVACIYLSGTSADGEVKAVSGELNSIMTGLACGEPNPVTWPILKNCSKYFVSVGDNVTATGMRVLANPLPGDQAIISGESGAITLGLLYALAQSETGKAQAKELGLNEESVVLIFSTEGDINPASYQNIVWNGQYPL
ncbi:diaminopropionate ammonia-lyase [Psychromonas ingrahamii 37]|uniref:Diaminopropionate ammonia-lyase n=1 Tax=Psychromonas ingrahamii (strain DSM 17664 / CCUG 51855 / 37) TaxID=357804 RepID=A1SWC6_PSYIN|nr:diaminopropionate ammonia-lyase [Psychromonas ingrahamii]ABM03791.1 diaminopropionate ammonia-lyase [Psychromonas ingrahamii 37]